MVLKNYKLLSIEEHKKLLDIRNLKHIREVSTTDTIILLDEHLEWVKNLENSKEYYGVFYQKNLIGGVHILRGEKNIWGMFFRKDIEPFISMMALYSFLEYLKSIGLSEIYGLLQKKNKPAYKVHKLFNIKMVEYNDEYYQTCLSFKTWSAPKIFKNKKINYKVLNENR